MRAEAHGEKSLLLMYTAGGLAEASPMEGCVAKLIDGDVEEAQADEVPDGLHLAAL